MKNKAFVNTCRFLDDDNRCEIYDFRPLGCRIFPFSIKHLTRERVQIRIHPTNICKSVKFSEEPENEKILKYVLDAYSIDLEEKIAYFSKYGDEM
jgi:Fe-S-cluster containining protein